jgi:hypothetical protein
MVLELDCGTRCDDASFAQLVPLDFTVWMFDGGILPELVGVLLANTRDLQL